MARVVNQLVRHVLKIFIASPSDLAEERRITREVATKINQKIGSKLGWHIEVLGSEDTLPGFGRPQAKINKDVADNCHLFIGLLWGRWGSPTGKYESGFEEEFKCAQKRHAETGSPEIWLCFKKVETVQMQDPGSQVPKVLAFREAQINAKELLFKEFLDPKDWKEKIDGWLTAHLLDLNENQKGVIETGDERSNNQPSENTNAQQYNDYGVENYQANQLKEALSNFTRAIELNSNYSIAYYNRALVYEKIRDFDKARADYTTAMLGDLAAAYNNMARLYIVQYKNYQEAVNLSLDGLKLPQEKQEKYALHKNIGWARLKQERYGEAEASLQEAIDMIPEKASAHCLLAQVLEVRGDRKGATVEWEKCRNYASSFDPDEDVWIGLAKRYLADDKKQ